MIYLKTSVGVELRGEDMLISSLQRNLSGGTFTHFTRITLFRLHDKEDLRREINHFFKTNRLGKDNVVLGIPRSDIILRYIELPSEVADNLKQVIQYQVQSFSPTEEEKLYYDYALMENGNTSKKKISVMLVMVRKTLLDYHLGILRDIGIRPAYVIGSSMGLSNICLESGKDFNDKTVVLADLTSSGLEVVALRHGAFAYSREVPRDADQSWSDLILREVAEAASKMRLRPEDTLDKIILAGEFSEQAHDEVKASIRDCELLKNSIPLTIPGENKPHLQEAASTLGLAYTGMVRRPPVKINLLPHELRTHQTRLAYVPAIIFGLAIIALLVALGLRPMVQNRKLIDKLDEQIQLLKAPVQRAQSIRDQADALEKRIRSMEDIVFKRDMNLEILQELTTILPADTYLNTYQYRDGVIQLGGYSASWADLIPKLEKSPLLKDVMPKGPTIKDTALQKDRFNLEAKLER